MRGVSAFACYFAPRTRSLIARRRLLVVAERAEKETAKSQSKKKKLEEMATLGDVNMNIWSYNDLLWRVVSSQAYRDHLEVIKPLIHKPSEELQTTYSKWIGDTGLEDGGELGVEETNAAEGALVAQEPVAGLEADEENESEESGDGRSSLEAFSQWMSLHVSHFQALRTLSRESKTPIATFHMIAHPPRNLEHTPLNWHRVIRNLCASSAKRPGIVHADKAIEILQNFIDSSPDRLVTHFGKFSSELKPGEVKFIGRYHCAAVAAACSAYPVTEVPTDWPLQAKVYFYSIYGYNFLNIVQISDTNGFSVSELCCPVCWELIQVLKEEGLPFEVRRHHHTISPIDLPHGLSTHVLQKMVARFRRHLYQQLIYLLDSPGRRRTASHVIFADGSEAAAVAQRSLAASCS